MHYYKRNLGDYAKKAGRLTMLQHGAYTLLIDSCYDREKFPTLDEALEWAWASTTDEIQAVQFVLNKFFVLENGVYVQKRIAEELAEYIEFCAQQKTKGVLGGRPKNPTGLENNPMGLKNNPTVTQLKPNETLTTNHNPLTTNQDKTIGNVTVAMLLEDGCSESYANELLSLRKKKRAPLTPLAWKGIKSEIKKAGMTLDNGIGTMSARGWQAFEASWVMPSTPKSATVVPAKVRTCIHCGEPARMEVSGTWYCGNHDQYTVFKREA